MRIVIPTRGRLDNQLTIKSLTYCGLIKRTTMIVPPREYNHFRELRDDYDVVAQPNPDWTIAKKRAWIIGTWAVLEGHEKIIMLDDDLRFATRMSETDWHLREIAGEELEAEFNRLEEKLGPEFPHVGFGPRQGNNTLEDVGWKTPAKMCYSLGYYIPIVAKECELGRIETREDMDITLQLLRKGYPNAVWQTTVNDQRKYDAPGGATRERTVESSNADAKRLADLHPGFVSTVEKKYKASLPRVEVIVQWQKALQDGQRTREAARQAS